MKHFIMTRFNLPPIKNDKSSKQFKDPDWVRGRCDTYEQISIPSFNGQTNQNFEVIVLMSSCFTPKDVVKRTKSWGSKIHPVYLGLSREDQFSLDDMKDIPATMINLFLDGDEDYIITSMCDSDDAYHNKYIERIQDEAKPNEMELLVFSKGGVLDIPNKHVYMQNSNKYHMYPSLVEPRGEYQTVLRRKHPRMHLIAPPRFIEVNEPYFLRGVDGSNIMTRIHPKLGEKVENYPISELKNYNLDL